MKDPKENLSSQDILDHIKPCWYWDKKDLAHTPSQSEGLDPGTEARYRREGARFIFDVGTRLGLYPCLIDHICVHMLVCQRRRVLDSVMVPAALEFISYQQKNFKTCTFL